MNWFAVVWAGFVATTLAAAFFWTVRSLGLSRFSPTEQLGCLFFREPNSPATETTGFVLLLVVGSTVLPAVYFLILEWLGGPGWATGAAVGAAHGLLTAALLPVTGTISACVRAGRIPPPGPLGIGWGRATPAGVLAGHALYGAVAGAILAAF